MKRRQFTFFLVGLLSTLLIFACSIREQPVTITVSAAASLQDGLEAIAPQFSTAYPKIAVDYNFGASGALQRQIEQGAPVDVFFSAATKQMDALADKALILPSSRQNLLTNRLVLIAPTASNLNITNLSQLKDTDISRFAVGEFRSVPAGQYAEQVFQKLDFLDALQSKFVFGNNVRSVLSAVESGNADLGMVYATDAALSERVKVILTVPADAHSPITYPIAVVQNSPSPEAAQTFINFLTTEPAQAIFQAFGFGQS
ncbi:molybdate ABC transporter substrate-binding protein [Leptolyngbya sp. BC1307]|uniref:molybdate ABC transporter substrate-binding protein n=1 Tax=Leptolyngbya sp. BC1307 TaxID=2029589 RepID=UPI000EFA8134|nr:molybdate ABC transporter substrate-binding protein [Leptolyngbya sp. BC1307]